MLRIDEYKAFELIFNDLKKSNPDFDNAMYELLDKEHIEKLKLILSTKQHCAKDLGQYELRKKVSVKKKIDGLENQNKNLHFTMGGDDENI